MALTNIQRDLISYIAENDLTKAKQTARIIVSKQKDDPWKERLLGKLEQKHITELPYNLQPLLRIETPDTFIPARHYLNDEQKSIVEQILSHQKVCSKLNDLKIIHPNTCLFYGEPGTGKTQLARRIAYELDLPLLFVDFSGLMDSYLGGTHKNIKRVFDFALFTECVLMVDEVDAIGMARGQSNEVKELERVVIGLMQEMDRLTSDQILIAATNRKDKLDPAFLRRFSLKFEITRFNFEDRYQMLITFFDSLNEAAENLRDEHLKAIVTNQDEILSIVSKDQTQSDLYQDMVSFLIQKLEKE